MIGLEIQLNGERIGTVGVGGRGVVSATVFWVLRDGREEHGEADDVEEVRLETGGLDSTTNEHVKWDTPPVKIGDLVAIKIIETESVSPPSSREKSDPKRDLERRKDYVRRMAEELGWTLTEQSPNKSA